MGEYIKKNGQHIKVGTCESLYYYTFQDYKKDLDKGFLSHAENNDYPANYSKLDSGYRFRFPFPDEDGLTDYEDFCRGLPVNLRNGETHEITQQKYGTQEDGTIALMVCLRSKERLYRIEAGEDENGVNDLKNLIDDIKANHIDTAPDEETKCFYTEVSNRILRGYVDPESTNKGTPVKLPDQLKPEPKPEFNPPPEAGWKPIEQPEKWTPREIPTTVISSEEIREQPEPEKPKEQPDALALPNFFGKRKDSPEPTPDNPLIEYLEIAQRAHHAISFRPEERGKQYINSYGQELIEDIQKLKDLGQDSEQIEKYIQKFKSLFRDWMHAKSRCMSSVITGPANFPVRRAEKANDSEHKKGLALDEFRQKVIARIKKRQRKEAHQAKVNAAGGEAALAAQKLEAMEAQREAMKLINKAYRAFKKKGETALNQFDLTDAQVRIITTFNPDNQWYNNPIAPFELTNLGQRIKAQKGRVITLERKEALKEAVTEQGKDNPQVSFEGGTVTLNYEIDRICIVHDEIPPAEIRTALKKNGFKWSRFYTAWIRQITPNAFYSLGYLRKEGILKGLPEGYREDIFKTDIDQAQQPQPAQQQQAQDVRTDTAKVSEATPAEKSPENAPNEVKPDGFNTGLWVTCYLSSHGISKPIKVTKYPSGAGWQVSTVPELLGKIQELDARLFVYCTDDKMRGKLSLIWGNMTPLYTNGECPVKDIFYNGNKIDNWQPDPDKDPEPDKPVKTYECQKGSGPVKMATWKEFKGELTSKYLNQKEPPKPKFAPIPDDVDLSLEMEREYATQITDEDLNGLDEAQEATDNRQDILQKVPKVPNPPPASTGKDITITFN